MPSPFTICTLQPENWIMGFCRSLLSCAQARQVGAGCAGVPVARGPRRGHPAWPVAPMPPGWPGPLDPLPRLRTSAPVAPVWPPRRSAVRRIDEQPLRVATTRLPRLTVMVISPLA